MCQRVILTVFCVHVYVTTVYLARAVCHTRTHSEVQMVLRVQSRECEVLAFELVGTLLEILTRVYDQYASS
jgi:hypothetical protein